MSCMPARNTRAGYQDAFWSSQYSTDPEFFGRVESPFSHWAMRLMKRDGVSSALELGFGYGRDTGYLLASGISVTGVEVSSRGYELAAERFRGVPGVRLHHSDALSFLRSMAGASMDAVYSNLFFNMHFTRAEHRALMLEIERVLSEGGLNLFSARSTNDPWYGKGRQVGPGTFDHSPQGTTMVYFSARLVKGITPPGLKTILLEERTEGEGDFPISVLYVCQKRSAVRGNAVPTPLP